VGKADRRGTLHPTKARPEQKIDAAVALMMVVGRVMEVPAQTTIILDRADLRAELARP